MQTLPLKLSRNYCDYEEHYEDFRVHWCMDCDEPISEIQCIESCGLCPQCAWLMGK